MRKTVAVVLIALSLAACSKKAPDPVEQIIVRKPGDPPVAAPSQAAAGDPVSAGKQAFAASCAACHAAGADAPKGVGPTLYGVIGRKAGSVPGFAYSDAMKASGITWSEASVERFLADPQGMVKGTTMGAGAVGSPDTRKAIAAWLATLGQQD
ncbi:c-type cytochrome [Novosphingobium sp. ZN18A2]|uniref:c-type cytochrome n=1 Tax=Novosphingobium sp. ZN18A2 TaxID=3079861 RepID=UPI0030CAFE1D